MGWDIGPMKALLCFKKRFWAIILSWALWESSWVGFDPTQSKLVVAKVLSTIGIEIQA